MLSSISPIRLPLYSFFDCPLLTVRGWAEVEEEREGGREEGRERDKRDSK